MRTQRRTDHGAEVLPLLLIRVRQQLPVVCRQLEGLAVRLQTHQKRRRNASETLIERPKTRAAVRRQGARTSSALASFRIWISALGTAAARVSVRPVETRRSERQRKAVALCDEAMEETKPEWGKAGNGTLQARKERQERQCKHTRKGRERQWYLKERQGRAVVAQGKAGGSTRQRQWWPRGRGCTRHLEEEVVRARRTRCSLGLLLRCLGLRLGLLRNPGRRKRFRNASGGRGRKERRAFSRREHCRLFINSLFRKRPQMGWAQEEEVHKRTRECVSKKVRAHQRQPTPTNSSWRCCARTFFAALALSVFSFFLAFSLVRAASLRAFGGPVD